MSKVRENGVSKLCWARSSSRHNKREATVLSVFGQPSQNVIKRKDYSPSDLHIHVLAVITKEHGMLDVLAYSETSYHFWFKTLQDIIDKTTVHNICYSNDVL